MSCVVLKSLTKLVILTDNACGLHYFHYFLCIGGCCYNSKSKWLPRSDFRRPLFKRQSSFSIIVNLGIVIIMSQGIVGCYFTRTDSIALKL